ncbi:MAG: hypothetical protein JNL83_13575 [Myxococcales bacterium]|nr:hypothetical protein [Myxococcales bacterium]
MDHLDWSRAPRTLDEAELSYRRPPDAPMLAIAFQRPTGRVEAFVQWHPGNVVEWAFEWAFLVPDHRRVETMEAITALNVILHVGRFDYDVPNHRIVFRAFHVARDQAMSAAQVHFFISSGLFAFDNLYLPLQDVCLRDANPLTAAYALQRVLEEQVEALVSSET